MSTLSERVAAALGGSSETDNWAALMQLFDSDREAFYLVAVEGAPPDADPKVRQLAELAERVRSAVAESYEIESADHGPALVSYSRQSTPIPANLVTQVRQFLRAVDGKTISSRAGKDYEGTEISEAEVRFKLGDPADWPAHAAKLEARKKVTPFVLRVSDEDLAHLAIQPAYVTHNLLNCARRTVLAPTVVFQGLQRGEGGPPNVDGGWAICGKPRRTYHNDGSAQPTPAEMVYVVYADKDRFVFDWDLVKENPNEPECPLDWQLRFGNPVSEQREFVLDLPDDLVPGVFDPTRPCYSHKGDCIFCYISDELAYATRVSPDLTVFKSIEGDRHTGFKVKNIKRILRVDQNIVISDDPEIEVSVESVLLASRQLHPETSVDIYRVLIALRDKVGEPPKVRVPRPSAQLVG